MRRRSYLQSLAVGVAGVSGCLGSEQRDATPTAESTTSEAATTTEGTPFRIETTTMELEVPWGAAFHPDGDLYLTERPGRIRRVEPNADATVADFTDSVAARGEGGLLGLAFHPDDPTVAYTYQTYEGDDGLANRVVRHRVDDDFAEDDVLLDGIPGASIHDGGRLAVAGNALYATTGDASNADLAQDRDSLAGKVLRMTLDGDPHPDNPFGNYAFTYGHRNPQGLAFRDGTLFATEHGPDTDDEINVLRAGENYGWPEVRGRSDGDQFTDPIATYTPTIAPGSATFYDGPIEEWQGDFFFGTLAGQHLRRVSIDDDATVTDQQILLEGEYGRLRTAFTGPDDHLYVTTSNRDGRGVPAPQDDRVLSIRPA